MKLMSKVTFYGLYLHKDTKMYLRLNRNQTAQQ